MTLDTPTLSAEALTVRVAELYYQEDRTQDEIGSLLGITRWKVGRLLSLAREQGIVKISIVHPRSRNASLENQLRDRFGLATVVVAAEGAGTPPERVARAAATYLTDLNLRDVTVGVSWGRTLAAVADALPDGWASGLSVVQVNGGVSLTSTVDTAAATAVSIARKGGGGARLLPSPAILERAETKRAIETDRTVAAVLSAAARASLYLYSAGVADGTSALVDSGYLAADEVDALVARGAVGDVLGRYVDASGGIVDSRLDERTIGLALDELRAATTAVFVVAGADKHPIARAVVSSGLCTVLVTDQDTANDLLSPSTRDKS